MRCVDQASKAAAGYAPALVYGGRPCGPTALRCSGREGGHTNSPSRRRDAAAQRRCARCSTNVWPTRRLKATCNPPGPALLSAAQCRCRRTPDHGFADTTVACVDEHLSVAARWAVSGVGDLWGGEKRSSTRGSPDPQGPDRREAMMQWRVQRRCERHRSRPCDASIAAQSACKADRHSRSPYRVPLTAPRETQTAQTITVHDWLTPAHVPRCAPLRAGAL